MDSEVLLSVLSRWIHVGTAIVIVGGTVFSRFVLLPAAARLPDEEHNALRERVMSRWKRFVHIGIVLFLLSGLYNYAKLLPSHKGNSLYHALIGTKILLALVVFFLASVFVGRSERFAELRKRPKLILGFIIALATVIVAISGFAKVALAKDGSPLWRQMTVSHRFVLREIADCPSRETNSAVYRAGGLVLAHAYVPGFPLQASMQPYPDRVSGRRRTPGIKFATSPEKVSAVADGCSAGCRRRAI